MKSDFIGLNLIEKNKVIADASECLESIAKSETKIEMLKMIEYALPDVGFLDRVKNPIVAAAIDNLNNAINYCLKVEKLNIARCKATTGLYSQLTRGDKVSRKDKMLLEERERKLSAYMDVEKTLIEEVKMEIPSKLDSLNPDDRVKFREQQVSIIEEYMSKFISQVYLPTHHSFRSYAQIRKSLKTKELEIADDIKNTIVGLIQSEIECENSIRMAIPRTSLKQ